MDIKESKNNETTLTKEELLELKCKQTKAILSANRYMKDPNFVNDMLALSEQFYRLFPNVDIKQYQEKLKDVRVLYFGKYTYKNDAVRYLPNDNVIMVNADKITKEEVDVEHALMKTVIMMITTNGNTYGFGNNPTLDALNVGFLDLTARAMVGDVGNSGHKQEREVVDFIGKRIGVEPFIDAFFTNNPQILMESMLKKYPNVETLTATLEQINNSMHTKEIDEDFIPTKLHLKLMDMFGKIDFDLVNQPVNANSQVLGGKTR